jgi:hypothetical protein
MWRGRSGGISGAWLDDEQEAINRDRIRGASEEHDDRTHVFTLVQRE